MGDNTQRSVASAKMLQGRKLCKFCKIFTLFPLTLRSLSSNVLRLKDQRNECRQMRE